jgi:hypothetical protein
MSSEALDKYVGEYSDGGEDGGIIRREGDKLQANMNDRFLDLIPRSKTEFALRRTGGKLVFELDEDGNPTSLSFHLGGEVREAQPRVR